MNTGPIPILFTWKPPRGLERIKECIPDLAVQVTDDRAEIMKKIEEVEVACVGHFDAEILRAAKKLRWVHAFSGGVNSLIFPEFVASPIPLTCLKGSFDIPAAEHALAVMLAFSRKLEYDIRQRPHRRFEESEPMELHGKTVGIVGLGNMGAEIARRCHSFGMRVLGLARRPRAGPSEVDQMLAPNELPKLLAASDFVIVAAPLTSETRGMMGEAQLRAMRKTAYLIDVSGRPAIYELDALTRALKEGWIAGASLQIVPESDSPLWDLENLLISFHRIVSREHYDRCIEMFCENLHRYRAGQPLLGLVDKMAGY
ncbi:MAG: D-2-hydroxyacid dehydrogenase [Verrucomicrobia bacterium]|nr:D-2-hydroxyacid dehydrogenase [Verrucomicrobiota bacterium]